MRERLRRLLKDSPEKFQRRMARLPLALLPETDRATARQYQQILARRGIVCRIENASSTSPGPSSFPGEASGKVDHRPPDPHRAASPFRVRWTPHPDGLPRLGALCASG